MIRRLLQLALAISISQASTVLIADGFPLKDGRYAGGDVVELELTKSQAELVQHHFKAGMVLKLTKVQRTSLKTKSKTSAVPTVLEIYKASDLAGDCTCFTTNVGLPFKPGWVEVPTEYLCSDKEAAARKVAEER